MGLSAETTIRSHLNSLLYNSAICWENYYLQLRFVPAAKDKMKKLKKNGEDDVDEDKDDPVVIAENFLLILSFCYW